MPQAAMHKLMNAKTLPSKHNRVHAVKGYDTSKLNGPEIRETFQVELRIRFNCLAIEDED